MDDFHQPDGSIHIDMEGKVIPPVRLSESQIDEILMKLKQKQIDEQIRSNKVIEGILNDISNGIDRIASDLENKT